MTTQAARETQVRMLLLSAGLGAARKAGNLNCNRVKEVERVLRGISDEGVVINWLMRHKNELQSHLRWKFTFFIEGCEKIGQYLSIFCV